MLSSVKVRKSAIITLPSYSPEKTIADRRFSKSWNSSGSLHSNYLRSRSWEGLALLMELNDNLQHFGDNRRAPMNDFQNKPRSTRRARDLSAAEKPNLHHRVDFVPSLSEEAVRVVAEVSTVVDVARRAFVSSVADSAEALFAVVRGRNKLCPI